MINSNEASFSKIWALFVWTVPLTIHSSDKIFNDFKSRSLSESSIPIVALGGSVLVGCLIGALLYLIQAKAPGSDSYLFKSCGFYAVSIFGAFTAALICVIALLEFKQDIKYYVLTNKDKVIAKLQAATSNPKKPDYRKAQIITGLIISVFLSFAMLMYFRMKNFYQTNGLIDYSYWQYL